MRIFDGRAKFYQWDLNQKIVSDKFTVGEEIHFWSWACTEALVLEAYEYEGQIVADVPNVLLQNPYTIKVYRYLYGDNDSAYTVDEQEFEIIARAKPDGYIYSETDVKRLEVLAKEILDEWKKEAIEEVTKISIANVTEKFHSEFNSLKAADEENAQKLKLLTEQYEKDLSSLRKSDENNDKAISTLKSNYDLKFYEIENEQTEIKTQIDNLTKDYMSQIQYLINTANGAYSASSNAVSVASSAQESATNAYNLAILIQEIATKAATDASNSLILAENAKNIANAAENSSKVAQNTAENAQDLANALQESVTNAQDAANAAQTAAINAQDSANEAQESATNAANSAANAQSSASNAVTMATLAKTTAENAQNAAENAQNTANNAQNSALSAQQYAKVAQDAANSAITTATTASTLSSEAKQSASNALSLSTSAQLKSESAQNNSIEAKETANEAKNIAKNVQESIENAQTTANNAMNAANSAQIAAENAQNAAENAQNAAENFQKDVDNAQSVANEAKTISDNAKEISDDTRIVANEAKSNADSAKTIATKSEETANNAIALANEAQETANNAVGIANNAVSAANNSQETANNAVEIVNNAYEKAEESQKNLDEHISVYNDFKNKILTLLESDDVNLDEIQEIVDYIKTNKELIDAITISKVSVKDIVDDLVTKATDKPLSANQGVVLKGFIDALTEAFDNHKEAYNTKVAELEAEDTENKQHISDVDCKLEERTKIWYAKEYRHEIFPETTINGVFEVEQNLFENVLAKNKLIVSVDGIEKWYTIKEIQDFGVYYVGNPYLMDESFPSTNEEFAIAQLPDTQTMAIACQGQHTIALYYDEPAETLPNGYLSLSWKPENHLIPLASNLINNENEILTFILLEKVNIGDELKAVIDNKSYTTILQEVTDNEILESGVFGAFGDGLCIIQILYDSPDVNRALMIFPDIEAPQHKTSIYKIIPNVEIEKLPEEYLPMDSELDETSERPVKNMVVAKAIGDIDSALDELHNYAQNLISGGTI